MARVITVDSHCTVTIIPLEIHTFRFKTAGKMSMINYGDGDLWISRRADVEPAIDSEKCALLKSGAIYDNEGGTHGVMADIKVMSKDAALVSLTVG